MADWLKRRNMDAWARSAGEPNAVKTLLFGVIALALALRLWGITFGLPYELTYDEGKEIHRALKLGAGEYY